MSKKMYVQMFCMILIICFTDQALAQQSDCVVKLPAISKEYSGGCKKGLANGKGFAKGVDSYKGQFSKGLPHGKGTYTWADGTTFKGRWVNGKRDGKGTLVYKIAGKDSVVTGYWKGNNYLGEKIALPYKIDRKYNVTRYSINKASDANNVIRIKLFKSGHYNTDIENFTLVYDNGDEYELGNMMGIQNIIFPVSVKVSYLTWNYLHTSQYDVIFEFTINEPGTWEVTIGN